MKYTLKQPYNTDVIHLNTCILMISIIYAFYETGTFLLFCFYSISEVNAVLFTPLYLTAIVRNYAADKDFT